ncbi:uncharacterized protein LOC116339858 [Contarinia nasturtii]|uniref:uncharacterized protein LOC116339858 n=1 Tax=Contarinia nasturtii TaxID=265458 RepID=UPI0012D48903|nr:uncharacterized protein LOC116339858 [Contarinia nasturtii]XP_031621791.1 uncharacterized protein LOC116339858 [Contarinia nasturtii]
MQTKMSQSTSKQFREAYNKYQKLAAEKKYEQSLNLLPQIGVKENYVNYTEHVNYILRSACYAMKSVKKTEYIISVVNEWKNVFSALSTTHHHEKFITCLKYFTVTSNATNYLSLFWGLEPSVFDLGAWLKAINTYLFDVLRNSVNAKSIARDDNSRKEIYLDLTQLLIVFVQCEAKRPNSLRLNFTESRRFLENCKHLKLFKGEGDPKQDAAIKQYHTCFKLLESLLIVLSSDRVKMEKAIQQFRDELKSLMALNELRATLVQDNMVTVAKMLKACDSHFIRTIDSKVAIEHFQLIRYIMVVLRKVKSEKTFCDKCDAVANHCSHELAMLTVDVCSALIEKHIDNSTIQTIESIIQFDFEAITKLKCGKVFDTQYETVSKFKTLMKNSESIKNVEYIVPVVKAALKCSQRFKLVDDIIKFDVVYICHCLFTILNAKNERNELIDVELINVGYLMMAFHSTVPEHPLNCVTIAWTIAKIQKENKTTITPYDHFNSPSTEAMYGLQLPKDFDVNKVALALLKVGFKFNVIAPELSNKIIHQMLMKIRVNDSNSLRFALSVHLIKFDKMTSDRVDEIVNALHAKSKKDPSIALQIAAIKYLRFHHETLRVGENHSNIHISESLTEVSLASDNNIFREITLDYEKDQVKMLHDVKKSYIDFTDFYLSQTEDERKPYEDEKDLLLRDFKTVANQFVVRGYIEDGLEMFMSLFKLSAAVNDDLGKIDACSFFAEHSDDFKQKYPKENLKEIIGACFTATVTELKKMNDLSKRKQNQICFCMLNFVLFYFAECGEHKREIHMILTFIFNAIGDPNDKTMEATVKAVVGPSQMNQRTNYKTIEIHSEAVRIKFYSVMFTIITKFGAPTVFHPTKFIHFAMNHVKKYLKLYFDSTVGIPIMLFNMLPQMIGWQENRYEQEVESKSLVITLLKLAVKSGYALRTANLMVILMQMDLMTEKLQACKTQFKALEHMMISNAPEPAEYKHLKSNALTVDNQEISCEPIRKTVSVKSPKRVSPNQYTGSKLTSPSTQHIRFLPNHTNGCECGLCFNAQNRLHVFCVAVAYARFAYINDDDYDSGQKRAIFTELIKYWVKREKSFAKDDLYYLICARMFMYQSHYLWKYEKNYEAAKKSMRCGLTELEKVKNGIFDSLKLDLQFQLATQTESICQMKMAKEEKLKGLYGYMQYRKKFDDETSPIDTEKMKKPRAPVKSTVKSEVIPTTPNPRLNLIDMVTNKKKAPACSNFQIYVPTDDATPVRSRRARIKTVSDVPKTTEKPKRVAKSKSPKESEPSDTDTLELSTKLDKITISSQDNKMASKPTAQTRTKKNLVANEFIDIITPPETDNKSTKTLSPETPITSKVKPQKIPKKPRCTNNKMER